MRRIFVCLLATVCSAGMVHSDEPKRAGYVGSESCRECHLEIYNKFVDSGHPYKIRRAHLATINTDPDYRMFTEDGTFAKAELALRYACLQCHQSRDEKWAAKHATGLHKEGKNSN